MNNLATPNESETIRAILFKEGDLYVAQCLEYDICAQGPDIPSLLDRLDLTVEAEFATCRQAGKPPAELIRPAPSYYQDLWDRRAIELQRKGLVMASSQRIEAALAAA